MAKVKYYYIEEYVCDCLELLRKMNETRDYSQLPAVTERIQSHVNAMENGLGRGYTTRAHLSSEEHSAEEIVEKLKKLWAEGS